MANSFPPRVALVLSMVLALVVLAQGQDAPPPLSEPPPVSAPSPSEDLAMLCSGDPCPTADFLNPLCAAQGVCDVNQPKCCGGFCISPDEGPCCRSDEGPCCMPDEEVCTVQTGPIFDLVCTNKTMLCNGECCTTDNGFGTCCGGNCCRYKKSVCHTSKKSGVSKCSQVCRRRNAKGLLVRSICEEPKVCCNGYCVDPSKGRKGLPCKGLCCNFAPKLNTGGSFPPAPVGRVPRLNGVCCKGTCCTGRRKCIKGRCRLPHIPMPKIPFP